MILKDVKKPVVILYRDIVTRKSLNELLNLGVGALYVITYLTKDKVPVVLATEDLSTISDVGRSVNELSINELMKIKIKESELVTIEELARSVKDKMLLFIKLGIDDLDYVRYVVDALNKVNYLGKSAIILHEVGLIKKVKEMWGSLGVNCMLYLTNPYPNISMLKRAGIDGLVMPYSLLRSRTVREAHTRGMDVIAWLVNDPAIFIKVSSLGVDGVITERPEIAREAEGLV